MSRFAVVLMLTLPAWAYADTIPKADRNAIKVEGTTWEGEDTLENKWKCTFEKDGALTYSMNGNSSKASWKQDGKKLSMECNNRYLECEGTIEKDRIKLDAQNVAGLKWVITIRPAKSNP